jgi:glycosyltransferase involved in cell wall biosynthesis
MKKLRIAQVGAIWEKTPPSLYGGTERIVYNLTEGLVKRGHKVTLFATGDSKTRAKLESIVDKPLYRKGIPWTNFLYPLRHISEVYERADEFDIIHMHLNTRQDYSALPLSGFVKTPTVFTTHFVWPLPHEKDKHDRLMLLKKYKDRNFVTISGAQRTIRELNHVGIVYNGIDMSLFTPPHKHGDFLVWIGRICHDKGTKEAIEVARRTSQKLIIAGKLDVHNADYVAYFIKHVEPYIDGKQITYIGEVNDKQKIALLKKAKALLNPINWNEPFGLVTIEAMAMGVPVVAFDRGPIRELVLDGKTGFIVRNIKQMVKAIPKVDGLNRKLIREYAERNFNVKNMIDGYEAIYEKVLKSKK